MTVYLEDNFLYIYSYLERQSTKPKILQDGKLLIASGDNDSITIYPRKNAVTVWGYNPDIKMLFAFNITYLTLKNERKTKTLQNIYEKIREQSKSVSQFEVGLIKGYKGKPIRAVNTIENWIRKNNLFQESQKEVFLCKNCFLVIDSKTGKKNPFKGNESLPTKLLRQTKKAFSLLCHQESSIKIPS